MPKVTVAIPSYNGLSFLEEAIESVLTQTFTDYELLICDHGSKDGSLAYLRETYGDHPKIRILELEATGEAVHNWNHLTQLAKGEYLKLLCMDDTLKPNCLERQVAALDAHPTASLAASQRSIIDRQGHTLIRRRGLRGLRGLIPGEEAIARLVRAGANVLGETSSVLIRTAHLREIGGWDNSYPYLIDQYNYMRLLESHDLVAIPEVLATFRLSSGQDSVRMRNESQDQMLRLGSEYRSRGLASDRDELLGKIHIRKTVMLRRLAYGLWRQRL